MKKEEIKKALECCRGADYGCEECPYYMEFKCNDILCNDALTLITEQEKEVERLEVGIERLKGVINDQNELCWSCKKSVKDFTEKLKERLTKFIWRHEIPECIFNDIVENLLKEYEK